MNKEELKYSYLEYSPDITEEMFDKIILKLKELGFIEFSTNNEYINFIKDSDSKLVLSPNGEYYVSDGNMSDRTKLKISDILGEETKFEVGKWYSFYWNWSSGYPHVGKVSRIYTYGNSTTIYFNYSVNISLSSDLDAKEKVIHLAEIKNIKELTLEEIQQYLPDGHVDKIKTVDKWWLNLKPGDKIKCTEVEQDSPAGNIYGGCGWKSNEIFTVRRVDGYESYGVIFIEEHNQQGIFTNSCTPYSEPKPLTTYNLVEGEIYYFKTSYEYIVKFDKLTDRDICGTKKIIIKSNCFGKDYNNPISLHNEIRLATSEEKHWLITSIKQDKFIPKEDLSKYDSEGNLIKMKEYVNTATEEQFLFVIAKLSYKSTGWTWRGKETCINLQQESYSHPEAFEANNYYTFQEWLDLNGYTFSDEEPKPIDKPFEFNKWYKPNNADGLFFIQSENTGYGFRSNYKNCWITNNKDYTWYFKNLIPASSEEVKERLLKYAKEKYPIGTQFKELNTPYSLRDFDEAEFDYYPKNDQLTCGQSIYIKGKWAEVISNPETQPIKTGTGIRDLMLQYPYQYRYKTIYSSSVWDALMNPPTQNSRAELKQESKVQNFIPEIPKVKNRFKTSPIKKRKLPEIY